MIFMSSKSNYINNIISKQIYVKIKVASFQYYIVPTDVSHYVEQLKDQIEFEILIPKRNQFLKFNDIELDDNKCLYDYDIVHNSVIVLETKS